MEIRIEGEMEAQLAREAEARRLALESYILEKLAEPRPVPAQQRAVSEAIDRIRELCKGNRLGGLRVKDLVHEGHKY